MKCDVIGISICEFAMVTVVSLGFSLENFELCS